MLPKKNRLNKGDIDKIFQKGLFLGSHNITLRFILNKDQNEPQVSFITPKIVSKKAIKRNSLRRYGYIALKDVFLTLPFGFKGVFTFNKKSLEVFLKKKKNLNLENEIKDILKRIKY